MPGQVVRIVNTGDVDFKDMYGGQVYLIPAHSELFVDYDAMCLWLGHPEANDFDPRNRTRVAEFARLRSRYGIDARSLEMSLSGQVVDAIDLFQSMRPQLEVFDTAGLPVITVADDPDGNFLHVADTSKLNTDELLMARMASLEQELSNLRTQQAISQRTEQALNDAQPIPADSPDLDDGRVLVHASGIPGTISVSDPDADADPTMAPRPTPRTTPGEDAPNRIRVSGA